jgi:hypothetical protein
MINIQSSASLWALAVLHCRRSRNFPRKMDRVNSQVEAAVYTGERPPPCSPHSYSAYCLHWGHHLFYNNLNGKPVGAPEHVIIGVTREQLNLTLGTLFAFLVNAFLGIAVTTSYTQIVWGAVKKRATTLETIDTVFYVVTSFWSLVYFSVWWKYPLLLLLALTIW